MKIPSDQHPHAGLQRRLQAYDPNFWLIFLPRLKRWAVLYEADHQSRMSPHLLGLPGCTSDRTRWQIGAILWDSKGRYLDPTSCAELVLEVVWKNDCRNTGSVLQRCKAIDERLAEKKGKQLEQLHAKIKDSAHVATSTTGRGKVLCTPAGVVNYGKD